MKKFLRNLKRIKWANVLCVFLAILCVGFGAYEFYSHKIQKNYYDMVCVVDKITENSDGTYNVLFCDYSNGNGWFITTNEHYSEKENYILTYNSMNTVDISDDEIIEIKRPID